MIYREGRHEVKTLVRTTTKKKASEKIICEKLFASLLAIIYDFMCEERKASIDGWGAGKASGIKGKFYIKCFSFGKHSKLSLVRSFIHSFTRRMFKSLRQKHILEASHET